MGHCWPGGNISSLNCAELLGCYALLSALWFGVGKARTTRPWDTANLAQPLRASLGSGMRQGAEEVIQSLKQSLLLSLCHFEK